MQDDDNQGKHLGEVSSLQTDPLIFAAIGFLSVGAWFLNGRSCAFSVSEQCQNPRPIDGTEVPGFLSYTANIDERSNSNPSGSNRSEVFITCGAAGLVSYTSCLLKGSDLPPGEIRVQLTDAALSTKVNDKVDAIRNCFDGNDDDPKGYVDCLDEVLLFWGGTDVSEGGKYHLGLARWRVARLHHLTGEGR